MSNLKSGLDYFSFDVDFFNDEKIEFIRAKFGAQGEIITIKLLCKIYRNGYYLKWDKDKCLLFSNNFGEDISVKLIDNVINELLKREFFNIKLFKKYQILTSHGIQKRYIEATKRRKKIIIYKEYLLCKHDVGIITDNVDIISINVNIIKDNVDIIGDNVPERKGKEIESKVKYLDYVMLTKTEYQKLIDKFGEDKTNDFIDRLNNGIGSKGYVYKSHYHTILNWDRMDKERSRKSGKYKTDISKKYRTI